MKCILRTPIVVLSTLIALTFLSGCSAGLHLYPVAGPITAQTPPPIFPARISANFASRSGTFRTTLANGEKFQGQWRMTTPGPVGTSTQGVSAGDLSAVWDQVYGAGFYNAHVLGNRDCGSASITGSRGTTLQVQICGSPNTKAVAKDSLGNTYKITVG